MKIPEDVQIVYTSPGGGPTDITNSVLYADAYFESQSAAVPGSFHLTVKDPGQTLLFKSGGVIELWVGGTKMFGGFITVPTRDFFLPADDTSKPIRSRRWSLDGIDFNYLLDKRRLRYPANWTGFVPAIPVGANCNDKHVISLFADYFDLDFSGGKTLDVTSKVVKENDFTVKFVWPQQGATMRETLDAIVIETTIHGQLACVYWVDADAKLNWLALQTTSAPWGFSDIPDGSSFIGWRDGSVSEDGSSVINEDFIWGGSPLGTNGAIVIAHKTNEYSIAAHGRWQLAENHPGEDGYKNQSEVNARANALISGDTSGTNPVTGAQGLVNPDEQYSLTWFSHDVPLSGDVRQHLVPGMVTTLNLWSFSEDGGETPFAIYVPLRQVRVTFPTLASEYPGENRSFVQFQGTFGLQMADPVWWWAFLRRMRPAPQAAPIITTSNGSGSFPYGSYFSDAPRETPNGSRTLFSIVPTYMPGSLDVYINGIPQEKGISFTETTPDEPTGGTFTFATAPVSGDHIVCQCRTG
jgi:hypothetical protein